MNNNDLFELLVQLGEKIQRYVFSSIRDESDADPVGHDCGDVTFRIDLNVHQIIIEFCSEIEPIVGPFCLVAEGISATGQIQFGDNEDECELYLLVDPIDGTRGLMYDLRSAWFLAGWFEGALASLRVDKPCVAVMFELPTSKHRYADIGCYSVCDRSFAKRVDLLTQKAEPLYVTPSTHKDLVNGFSIVSDFFQPGTSSIAADLACFIASECCGEIEPGSAKVFNDQYISTGGQMYLLAAGKYRFCADLRPIFYDILEKSGGAPVKRGLVCHPYDLVGVRVAASHGVIFTDGFGGELIAPVDVTSAIHWCGYANSDLQALIEPVIQAWVEKRLQRLS